FAAERFRPRQERGHAPCLDLFDGLVQDVERVLDLASQEVEAAEQRERLTEGLTQVQPARACDGGTQELAGSRVIPDIVPASTADQLDPRELLVVPDDVVGCAGQRFLRSFVLPAQELDPADLAPTRRGEIVSSRLLRERRSFVQRCGALLVRATSRVDERAAQRNERSGEQLAVADPSSSREGTAQSL